MDGMARMRSCVKMVAARHAAKDLDVDGMISLLKKA
jgi:hypothetical protein